MRVRAAVAAGALLLGLGGAGAALGDPAQPTPPPLKLARAFHARSDWRLTATQGPPTTDDAEDPVPGRLTLCLEKSPAGPCLGMPPPQKEYAGWDPHYLLTAEPVFPRGPAAAPLLLIVTASLQSGDGDQVVVTQLFKYDRSKDAFGRVYAHATGRNNNQEDRFVRSGPLAGGVISAEPTQGAPFGFWIEVSKLTPAYTYEPVLHYRSATRYGDGNPLAVIDSEMANIEQRLGLWRPGQPLPAPPGPCPKPHLVGMELWCR